MYVCMYVCMQMQSTLMIYIKILVLQQWRCRYHTETLRFEYRPSHSNLRLAEMTPSDHCYLVRLPKMCHLILKAYMYMM